MAEPEKKSNVGVVLLTGALFGTFAWAIVQMFKKDKSSDEDENLWAEQDDGARPIRYAKDGRYLDYAAHRVVFQKYGSDDVEEIGVFDDKDGAEEAAEVDAELRDVEEI